MTDGPAGPPSAEERRAALVIRQGGVVAFPTETYYGLAVDPFNDQALARLFRLKQRPLTKPVLVLIKAVSGLERLASGIPPQFKPLMARFWPGPLTLIFPARPGLSPLLTAGTGTVGVRLSSHPQARRLAALAGGAITATSANLSGQPPAAGEAEVLRQFGAELDYLLAGGDTAGGQPSTVLAAAGEAGLTLVRPGALAFPALAPTP